MAAAINVAITRTSLATTLILVFLSGEQDSMSAVLAASLASLFATGYMVRHYVHFECIIAISMFIHFSSFAPDARSN
jgi:hypothetical protein